MLRELSNVAIGLLGLHGYPLQPFGWGGDGRGGQRGEVSAPKAAEREAIVRAPARAARRPGTNAVVGAGC